MTVTRVIVLLTLAVWLAWDVAAYFTGRETESDLIRALSRRPAVPFVCGVLCGHWFFT